MRIPSVPHPSTNTVRRIEAFTLVETLISVLIVAILFTSLYAGVTYGFAMIALSRENLRATQILVEKMETLRLYNWDQINTAGFIPTNFTEPYTPGGGSGGFSFTGFVSIADAGLTAESYSNDLKRVMITLDWESGGVLRTREMETFVARNGLQSYIY